MTSKKALVLQINKLEKKRKYWEMKKQVEYCDECEEEVAEYEIIKGEDKGRKLCSDCLDDYRDNIFEEYYGDLK